MRARLAAAEEQLAGNEELAQRRSRLAEVDDTLASLRSRQRRAEAAIEDLGARIEREEKKLYDGSIKQFKELQALEGDIGHVRDERRTAEDGMLEVLSDIESAEARTRSTCGGSIDSRSGVGAVRCLPDNRSARTAGAGSCCRNGESRSRRPCIGILAPAL